MSVRRCSWSLSGIDLALVAAGNLRLTVGVDSDGTRHAGGWPGGRATSRRVVRACIARSLLRGPPHPHPHTTPPLASQCPLRLPQSSAAAAGSDRSSFCLRSRSAGLCASHPVPSPSRRCRRLQRRFQNFISLRGCRSAGRAGRGKRRRRRRRRGGCCLRERVVAVVAETPSPEKGNGTERRAPRPPSL